MANMYKIPSPSDLLKPVTPPAGPPVPNSGGIPSMGMAPQRLAIPALPTVQAGPPGPAPGAVPPTGPPALPGAAVPGTQPAVAGATPTGAPSFTFNFGAAPSQPQPQGAKGELWPDAQAPPAPPAADPSAPPTIPEAPYRPVRQMAYVPRRFEVASLQPGEGASTPVGDVYRDVTTGRLKLRMNEAGKMAYRQKETARLKEFGTYPMSTDPLAPQPDVTPGKPVYDAFRGRWIS